jgi:hypothetical protein
MELATLGEGPLKPGVTLRVAMTKPERLLPALDPARRRGRSEKEFLGGPKEKCINKPVSGHLVLLG